MTEQTTKEFAELRIKAILKQMVDLRSELAALRSLKGALSGKNTINTMSRRSSNNGPTFQDMIVDVLNDEPSNGAEALKIIELIKTKHGKVIARSSISPQLSRLKAKGVLVLNNNVWSLTEFYKKNKVTEAPPNPEVTLQDLL